MQIEIRYRKSDVEEKIRQALDSAEGMWDLGRGVMVPLKKACKISQGFFNFDEIVDEALKFYGQAIYRPAAEYFYAKAVMCAASGDRGSARIFHERARSLNSGGVWAERYQTA